MITLEQLNEAFPDATEEDVAKYYNGFIQVFEDYEINTPKRQAAFIAQVAHESGQLRHVVENLNYSSQGLLKVFKKYFNAETAAQYARKPEMIANRVYGNRMGNGPESSGEGWMFRGRGLIQLTGKSNYSEFAEDMGMSLEEAIAYLETPEGAVESAAWFWDKRNLNSLADRGDIVTMTKRINGGTNGLQERIELYEHALSILDA
jgi:putative chitinase